MPATATANKLTPFRDALIVLFLKHPNSKHLKQIHSILVTSGLSQDNLLLKELLRSLTISQTAADLSHAYLVFDQIEKPDIQLWNTMIRGYTSSQPQMSLSYFVKMRQDGIGPNKHTFPLLLKAFSKSKAQNPFQVYAQIMKFGMDFDHFVKNALVSAFANCGFMDFARKVFDENANENDAIAWTALIDGYVRNDCPVEGLRCFLQMRSVDVRIDEVTIVTILCGTGMVGNVWFGRSIHGFYVESGRVHWDVYVGSALIDMYSKCGYCDDSHKVFNQMASKNMVSWSTLISGYVQCNRYKDALAVFQDMLLEDVKPNHLTLTSVLTACAQLGVFDQGRWVHEYINRNMLEMNSTLGTALIDMYAKCGCIDEAMLVFRKWPLKNVYPWTAMINGLAMHGNALGALDLFSCMLRNGIRPNEVTFIGVLSACSHGGLVQEGREVFGLMSRVYCLKPDIDHYGCMVDLLGKAGRLEEAIKFVEDMPLDPTPSIWGSLFGSCMIHKAYELGEHIGKHLIKLQPHHSGRYALLANLYAACQNWEAAARTRKLMKERRVGKTPGCSSIEVHGEIHEFISFDKSHARTNDIYVTLDGIFFPK